MRRAYRRQALPLKTQLLTAPRVWLKDRYREDLRDLVLARDAAHGLPDRPGWRAPGLSGRRLFSALVTTDAGDLDDRGARAFLGVPLTEATPDHSSLTRVRQRLPEAVHEAVFVWVLGLARERKLLAGAAVGVDATTLEANAAMKAIDPTVFESATDLGAGWWVQARRILIPLAAPGIFIAMILVYIPMLTDFVTSDIVGGTSSYMMGQRVRDLILQGGTWGPGAALNFIMLGITIVFSLIAYRFARLNQIQTS